MIRQCVFMFLGLFSGRHESQSSVISEIENSIELHEPDQDVFPNPFTDEINLKINGHYHFQLISSSGKLIQEGNSSQQSIILGHFFKGIYLLKITQGDKSRVLKLVKE